MVGPPGTEGSVVEVGAVAELAPMPPFGIRWLRDAPDDESHAAPAAVLAAVEAGSVPTIALATDKAGEEAGANVELSPVAPFGTHQLGDAPDDECRAAPAAAVRAAVDPSAAVVCDPMAMSAVAEASAAATHGARAAKETGAAAVRVRAADGASAATACARAANAARAAAECAPPTVHALPYVGACHGCVVVRAGVAAGWRAVPRGADSRPAFRHGCGLLPSALAMLVRCRSQPPLAWG